MSSGAAHRTQARTTRPRLVLMGGFRFEQAGSPVLPPLALQRLLALLALRGPFMPRHQVAGVLWPDKSEARALANLRSTLWRASDEISGVLVSESDRVGISGELGIDTQELERQCLASVDAVPQLDEIMAFTRTVAGDLLPGWYEDWVLFEREKQRQIHLYGMESLTDALLRSGRHADAVIVGLAVVACEPFRESAHRLVIEAHLAMGNVAEARRQLEMCRHHLRTHLGLDASPGLAAVFESYGATAVDVPRVRPFGAR